MITIFLEILLISLGICGLIFWFLSVFTSMGRGPAKLSITEPISVSDKNFLPALEGVTRDSFLDGGLPEILNNGDEFFPRLLEDIKNAKKTIHIAVFILRPQDEIGKQIINALLVKAKEGVKVRLLIDSRGSNKFSKVTRYQLSQAGIDVVMFRPFRFGILTRYHKRNHSRAFIIDGAIGYTGGAAIGQEWTGNAQDTKHWRDMMFRMTGVQAQAIQHIFSTLWANTCGQTLVGESVYPVLMPESIKSKWMSFISSPALENNLLRNVFWLSCAGAQKGIYIQNAYFFPSKYMRHIFMQKAREGIEVVLMLPNGYNDEKIIYYAGRYFYDRLLSAGVKIYEYQSTMMHAKNFLVDDIWSIVGSANMDVRSEELNEESVMCILSEEFGKKMRAEFNADLKNCKEVTLAVWRKRPFYEKILEFICTLLGHQL